MSGYEVRLCLYCGTQFKPRQSNHYYCTKQCGINASKKRKSLVRCGGCGKQIYVKKTNSTNRRYCNDECKKNSSVNRLNSILHRLYGTSKVSLKDKKIATMYWVSDKMVRGDIPLEEARRRLKR